MNPQTFQKFLGNNSFRIENPFLDKAIQQFSFYFIADNHDILNILLKKNINNIIIIDKYINSQKDNELNDFYVITFDYRIFIIRSSDISLFFPFFSLNKESIIYFLNDDAKISIQEKNTNIILKISDEADIFFTKKEIPSFIKKIKLVFSETPPNENQTMQYLWKIIHKSFAGFLIKIGYLNSTLNRIPHYKSFFSCDVQDYEFTEDEFIELRSFHNGYSSYLSLIYLIEKEQICLLKMFLKTNEEKKLYEREHDNYLNIHHPFLPRYFGTTVYQSYRCLIIEYLEGKTLDKIDFIELSNENFIKILFEIMLVIEYLQYNGYIYRDLKPNNVIVDKNNMIYLIDFDRMIKNPSLCNNEKFTVNFMTDYIAPEIINEKSFSNKADIYSLGKVIAFLISNYESKDFFNALIKLGENCMEINETKRPTISDVIDTFYTYYFSKIYKIPDGENLLNHAHHSFYFPLWFLIAESQNEFVQLYLGHLNEYGIYICKDRSNNIDYFYLDDDKKETREEYKIIPSNIVRAIHYYTLSANQNNSQAQYILGEIYYDGIYVQKDINKAIYYMTLAAMQNNVLAQFYLGVIFIEGVQVQQNISEGIHYLTLAANQNYSDAQYNLGIIYYDGKYVPQNINKSFHFFKLASDQNNSTAQYNLGAIFYEGIYVQRDIQKAIHYFALAAKSNNLDAMFNLGTIFYEGKYVSKDLQKAIHYLSLASVQKHVKAQYNLGIIYYNEMHDINNAIHYLSLASDQNHSQAQLKLGVLYYEGRYIPKDIDKAIRYFSLSANQNNASAEYYIGRIYFEGKYVQKDIGKALYFLTRAANKHISSAQSFIGRIYYQGIYVKRDINKALQYLDLAANKNNSEALFLLGEIYHRGDFVQKDIKRAIHYYNLASNVNNIYAQFNLGIIYMQKKYEIQNINKAIYYFSLCSNQNNIFAQLLLAEIYYEGEYVTKNINKAIHYYSLAAKNGNYIAQLNLGLIYYEGQHVPKDISKAIHYLSLSSNQMNSLAQFWLGYIYYLEDSVQQNINKAVYYLTLSSNQNNRDAQFHLGLIYFEGKLIKQDIKKAVYLIMLSAKNGNKMANFLTGVFYHEGKYVNQDIEKAIHYYKEASSFNIQYAKNNLGIIFKNGFYEKVSKNNGLAIEYFREAIHQKGDYISMYNLAHLYLYEDPVENSIDKSIKLLSNSYMKGFLPSQILLCLALIKKYGNDSAKLLDDENNIPSDIIQKIKIYRLDFDRKYESYRKIDFLYGCNQYFPSFTFKINNERNQKEKENQRIADISDLFYEGFDLSF